MIEVNPPLSMPSTLASNHYTLNYHLPPLSRSPDAEQVERSSCQKRFRLDEHSVNDWLQHSAAANGLRTPPKEMNGVSVNPLLAPNVGGLQYKSVPAVRSTTGPHATSLGTVASIKYHSKAPPSHDFRSSVPRPQSPTFQRETALSRGQPRGRNTLASNPIASYLQIPSTINDSKGSLAEFAAQVRWAFHR